MYAVENCLLRLKHNDVWEDGWKVNNIYGEVNSNIIDREYKQNRNISFRLGNT
jgi:hypothetical protein